MYYKKHIFKTLAMNHSFNPQDLFTSNKWPVANCRLSSTCHPPRRPPATTCHGTPGTIQGATTKGMTTQRTITTTTSQTHLWFIQSRGVLLFFCCFLLKTYNFQPTLETNWFCGKVSSLYLSKTRFFGVIQLGLLTWNNFHKKPSTKLTYTPLKMNSWNLKITSLKRKLI